MPEPAPRRIVRQHGRDLRQGEHEHEIEEELERRHALSALGVYLAHTGTLTRTASSRRLRATSRTLTGSHRLTKFGEDSPPIGRWLVDAADRCAGTSCLARGRRAGWLARADHGDARHLHVRHDREGGGREDEILRAVRVWLRSFLDATKAQSPGSQRLQIACGTVALRMSSSISSEGSIPSCWRAGGGRAGTGVAPRQHCPRGGESERARGARSPAGARQPGRHGRPRPLLGAAPRA